MMRHTASLHGRIFVLGGTITPFLGKGNPAFIDKNHPDFGTKSNRTLADILHETVAGTMANTRMTGKEHLVDTIAVGNFLGELSCQQGHLGSAVIGSLVPPGEKDAAVANPLLYKPSLRVEGACASGGLAVMSVVNAIKAGTAEVGLAVGVEVQTTVSARVGGDYLARASDYTRQRCLDDFTFPCIFAKRMKYIAEKHHFTLEDTARVATKAYENANRNPLAHMHTKIMSLEECYSSPVFLENKTYRNYLRLSDCSQVSDGGAGVILASEAGLQKLGLSVNDSGLVELKALACATASLYHDPIDATRMQTMHTAAQQALGAAKVKPEDLQVAEVHDCFTIAELLMYEALGIAPYGKARDLIRNGDTTLTGRIPVNTGGGLIAFGHPVGATGVKQVMEIYRQMKGQCGDYQLPKTPTLGATLNMGGDDKTAVSIVLQNI